MNQQLPRPLAYYLEKGVVTENHVRQATKLRNIYGQEPLLGPFAKEICAEGSDFVDSPERALEVLAAACPEEVSLFYIYEMPPPSALVIDGCRLFAAYVSEHGGYVPQWVATAFWWLSYAVDGSLSANDLSIAIKRWHTTA